MAWKSTYVNDSIFAGNRIPIMQSRLGCTFHEALGLAVTLWRDSQNEGACSGNADQILLWCRYFKPADSKDGKIMIQSLLDAGLISYSARSSKPYAIVGNKKHLDAIKTWKKKCSDGGKKSVRAKARKRKEGLKPSAPTETGDQGDLKVSSTVVQGYSSSYVYVYGISSYEEIVRLSFFPEGDSFNLSPGDAAQLFITLWNEAKSQNFPKAKLTKKRQTQIMSRLQDSSDFAYWQHVIAKLTASNFCNGDNNRGWVANVDFLLRPDTHVKADEGLYDNRSNGNGKGNGQRHWQNGIQEHKEGRSGLRIAGVVNNDDNGQKAKATN